MSTIGSFLEQLEREIEANTLPPLPGTAPSLEPQPDECPTVVMRDSVIAYLTGLQEIIPTLESIAHRHPELHDQAHGMINSIIGSMDNLVRQGDALNQFLEHVCTINGLNHNQQGEPQC